jgi:hypothetical protein
MQDKISRENVPIWLESLPYPMQSKNSERIKPRSIRLLPIHESPTPRARIKLFQLTEDKIMQLITQLDDDAANKLTYIQQQTGQDTEAILKTAIEQYYQQLQTPQKTALDISDSSLICVFSRLMR